MIQPHTLLKDPGHLLALGMGAGCAPVAPGTFGTLAALPWCWLAWQYLPLNAYITLTVFISLLGIWLCGRTAHALGVHDHGAIVWDEWAGLLITMTAAPRQWYWLVAGFVLFRLFDIVKPWPVSLADKKIHGGLGIMLDDVLAALYALLILQLLIRFSQ